MAHTDRDAVLRAFPHLPQAPAQRISFPDPYIRLGCIIRITLPAPRPAQPLPISNETPTATSSSGLAQLPASLPVYPPTLYALAQAPAAQPRVRAVARGVPVQRPAHPAEPLQTTSGFNTMDVEARYPAQRPARSWLTSSWWESPAIHPQLYEVLNRKTRAPVDLYSFYIYMRDIQYAVDYLDFWLDVSQHMSLCRHYVRDLRRSVLADTPDAEAASKRSSAGGVEVAEAYDGAGGGPSEKRNYSDNRVSRMLRNEQSSQHSHSNSQQSNTSRPSPHQPTPRSAGRPGHLSSSSNSPATGQDHSGSSSSPQNAINRQDVRASAERILYTYLLAGSEREIILPQSILNEIVEEIEQNNRDDPEVFDAAQDYVYQAMNRDAFPGFLQSKALGNLIPISMTFRVTLGLLALWGALWAGFVLIFLNETRRTRCWLILPFTIGTYYLNSYQWMLDPIIAIAGFSEYTLMNFNRIHEPYVRRLLIKRSMIALLTFLVVDTALCCLFIFVPGSRL